MIRAARARVLALAAAAAVGVVVGHQLTYVLVTPDGSRRAQTLAASGHEYLAHAAIPVLVAALVAVLSVLLAGLVRGGAGRAGPLPLRWSEVTLALLASQGIGFVVLEGAERLAAGAPLSSGLWWVVLPGLLMQALVAGVAALVLVLADRAGEAVGRWLAPRRGQEAARQWRPTGLPPAVQAGLLDCRAPRAPPLVQAT